MQEYGRSKIFTQEFELTEENIVTEVLKAYNQHTTHVLDITYLWDYYKGKQPILEKVKNVREEINYKIVENHAAEIVDFFSGYLLGEPCSYVSREDSETVVTGIEQLNRYMENKNKAAEDKNLATWLYVCGIGYQILLIDNATEEKYSLYTLDPRQVYVIRSYEIGQPIICGVLVSQNEDGSLTYSGYTKTHFFRFTTPPTPAEPIVPASPIEWTPHALGDIPIFEFESNMARLGAFESVITMLDAINAVQSNRVDGIEQFVQSLMVLYNADIDNDKLADLSKLGFIKIKNSSETAPSKVELLTSELNQSETQTLVDDMVGTVKTIVGMPSNNSGLGGGASGNVGSVLAWQGWDLCEPRIKETETLFKKAERRLLKVLFHVLNTYDKTFTLSVSDIEIKFSRRNIENLLTKTQALQTLLAVGIKPEIAIATIGLWNDPVNVATQSEAYMKEKANVVREGSN